MPNTIIALKKSSTPAAKPTSLSNGEIAINYADGKLFYKNTAGFIAEISDGGGGSAVNSFDTIIANGTTIVADSSSDTLTISVGPGIEIVGDAINDTITISSSVAVSAFSKANTACTKADTAQTTGVAAFSKANTACTNADTAQTTGVAAFSRANNSLLSSSYTASDVLSKLLTVDGVGSGLDADLLDGQHGSYYSPLTVAQAAFAKANNTLKVYDVNGNLLFS